jgi:type II secretory pathway pseudopilin PulG
MIELVTVIVVLGIIAVSTVGPTLSYLDSMRNRAASARIVSDIRYMQRLALSSGLRTWVTFNVAGNSYQLYMEDRNNLGKANRIAVTDPMYQSTSAIAFGTSPFVNVTIGSASIGGTAEIEFDGWGAPYNGSGVALSPAGTISLSSGVSVTIQPVSGYAERAG